MFVAAGDTLIICDDALSYTCIWKYEETCFENEETSGVIIWIIADLGYSIQQI